MITQFRNYRLWEEKYGGTAKHLGKTKAKRTRKTHILATVSCGECLYFAGTKTRVSGLTREAHSLREMHGRSGESKSLHPSWTAKKQQQTTIQQFQGQKITFDSE